MENIFFNIYFVTAPTTWTNKGGVYNKVASKCTVFVNLSTITLLNS